MRSTNVCITTAMMGIQLAGAVADEKGNVPATNFDSALETRMELLEKGSVRTTPMTIHERNLARHKMQREDAEKTYRRVTHSTLVRRDAKIGRNDPCKCGSGEKFKRCCLNKNDFALSAAMKVVR